MNQNFERSVRSAPNPFPLSITFFHFSSIARRQCWVLYPFLKSHMNYFKKCLSLNNVNCLHVVYRPQPATLLKKETLADVFSCEYCKISKTTFSGRTTPVAAFVYSAKILAFSFIMLTGISVLSVAFRMPNFFWLPQRHHLSWRKKNENVIPYCF